MKKPDYIVQSYKAKDGCRWRMIAKNGRIVAESGESYQKEATMIKTLKKIFAGQIEVRKCE